MYPLTSLRSWRNCFCPCESFGRQSHMKRAPKMQENSNFKISKRPLPILRIKKNTIALNLPSIKVQWAASVKKKKRLNIMFKLLCEWDIILCKTLDGGLFCGILALLAVKWFNVSVSGGSSNDIGAVTENKKPSTNNWTKGQSLYLWGQHYLELLPVLKVIIYRHLS